MKLIVTLQPNYSAQRSAVASVSNQHPTPPMGSVAPYVASAPYVSSSQGNVHGRSVPYSNQGVTSIPNNHPTQSMVSVAPYVAPAPYASSSSGNVHSRAVPYSDTNRFFPNPNPNPYQSGPNQNNYHHHGHPNPHQNTVSHSARSYTPQHAIGHVRCLLNQFSRDHQGWVSVSQITCQPASPLVVEVNYELLFQSVTVDINGILQQYVSGDPSVEACRYMNMDTHHHSHPAW